MTAVESTYTDRQVTVGNLNLHYQEWGDSANPAMLLIHGFGVSGHMFDEFAERARERYHLIALDQRGHGDSDWAEDGDYSREAFVVDIEGFRKALGLERFILVGHSMGGLNAVSYTVAHPQNVRALVLVDVGPEAAAEGVDNIVRFTRGPDELDFDEFVEMAHRFNPRRSLDNIRDRMRHRLKPTDNGKWTWKFDKRFRSNRDELKIGSELSNDDTWKLFREVAVPCLLVRGAESDVLTQEVAERAAREMQRTELVVVPGAGHSVPGDNPDDFTSVVLSFVDQLESGDAAVNATEAAQPISDLVRTTHATRRRPGVGTLVVVAAGAFLATLGVGMLVKRRKDKKRRESKARAARARATRAAQAVPVDFDATQARLTQLASDLAALGKTGAERARELAQDPHVTGALAQAKTIASEAGQRGVEAARNVDTTKARKRGAGFARQTRHLLGTGATLLAGRARGTRKRSKGRRRWRS